MTLKNISSKIIFSTAFAAMLLGPSLPISQIFADSTNLMPNPTFTADPSNLGIPMDWKFSTFGTNTSTSQYPAVGPDASTTGLKVIINSYTNGFSDWFTNSVPVTPFATYHFSDSYLSDTTGVIEAQFSVTDTATGAVTNLYTDLGFTASTTGWAQSDVSFIAPVGATSVTIYHLINNIGSLTIANLTLTKTADPATFPQGMVTLTFDDGTQSQYNQVFPVLSATHIPATFYIVTQSMLDAAQLGTSTGDVNNDYMTASEVLDINRAGNEIGNHTVNHCNLVTGLCPDAEIPNSPDPLSAISEIVQASTTLRGIGALPVDTFAYPYGAYSSTLENDLVNASLIGGRSVDRGYNLRNSDRYALKIQYVNASSTTDADFQANIKPWIDEAVKDHVWLVLLMHQIEPADVIAQTHDADATTPQVLSDIVNYLKQNNVSVVTLHTGVCMMDGMAGDPHCSAPTVPGPIATSTNPGGHHDHGDDDCTHDCDNDNGENTPPAITLVGNNPLTLTLGQTFTDPGAIANDVDDGNLTSHIIVTGGPVDTTVLGTTTLTYSVTDSGGLTASTTRIVIVSNVSTGNSCDANTELITNGGFEYPTVDLSVNSDGAYEKFPFNTPGLGWSTYNPDPEGLEIDVSDPVNVSDPWVAHSGNQYNEIELGPTNDISQNIATIPGNTYALSYWISPHPDFSDTRNNANVYVGGALIEHLAGVGGAVTQWALHTHTFVATTTSTRLSFVDENTPASTLGMFLDDVSIHCQSTGSVNQAPIITLLGANPLLVTFGQPFIDPGATANDAEDGNLTSHIIVTGGLVDTTVLGTTTLTYSVTDSGGLTASTTRQVVVVPANGGCTSNCGGGGNPGSITFCLVIADTNNTIATSSLGLPSGSFNINLATTTDIATSTIDTQMWTTTAFAPNQHTILSTNDSDCVTYNNLPLGSYYFSQASTTGGAFLTPKYNDQFDTPVNSLSDFFAYSPELFTATTSDDTSRNLNSDGNIVLSSARDMRTLVVLETFNPASTTCTSNCGGGGGNGPDANLSVTKTADKSTADVGDNVTYTITVADNGPDLAPSTTVTDMLPAGLDFVSASTSVGVYATSTGVWTIGDLLNGSSTTLTIIAAIKSGTEGQTITNTAIASSTQNDSNTTNNTATSTVVVNTNGIGGCQEDCGGGGGNGPDANLAVTKTADKSTANVGDTVTYTITVTDNGPDRAPSTTLVDLLPSGLNFVSASSTTGTYATSTGLWIIGDLLNGSSTTLTIVATIATGTEGQTITNTAVASSTQVDSNTANNTSTSTVTVNNPGGGGGGGGGCTSNCGGGGGGGNGPIVGSTGGGNGPIVLGTSTSTVPSSCDYLHDYLHIGWNNDPNEVKKLQVFLRDLEGYSNVVITGVYDDQTVTAVDAFQLRYANDILVPWGDAVIQPSHFTYILTKKKVNEIYCQTAFPITTQEQSVIDAYRTFVQSLQNNGVQVTPGNPGEENQTPTTTNEIGQATTSSNSSGNPISNFFSNLAIGGPNSSTTNALLKNTAAALLGFPWNWMKGIIDPNQCIAGNPTYCKWLDVILALLIIGILYLLFKPKKKSLDEVNRDLDLK